MTPRNRIRIMQPQRPEQPGLTLLRFDDFTLHTRGSVILVSPLRPYKRDTERDTELLQGLIHDIKALDGVRKIHTLGGHALGIFHDPATTWQSIRDQVVVNLQELKIPYQIVELPRQSFKAKVATCKRTIVLWVMAFFVPQCPN